MNSIILPTPDVQAIQAGRKTSFRVPLMPQPEPCITSAENWRELVVAARAPYQPGDRLYVKETVTRVDSGWWYKSDGIPNEPWGRSVDTHDWWTAATMPREAARLFLMVKAVRVERVQEITDEQCIREGFMGVECNHLGRYACEGCMNTGWLEPPIVAFMEIWNARYAKPRPVRCKGKITHYISYPWENVQETREHKGLPWYVRGNPWVWVVEFEREGR